MFLLSNYTQSEGFGNDTENDWHRVMYMMMINILGRSVRSYLVATSTYQSVIINLDRMSDYRFNFHLLFVASHIGYITGSRV